MRRDLIYKTVDDLTLRADVYVPEDVGVPSPAVIFVHGDALPERICNSKDSGQYRSWAHAVASRGMSAVTFNHRSSHHRTRIEDPASDVADLLAFVRAQGRGLGLDVERLAIWTCSAGPPFIVPAVIRDQPADVRALVVYYGLLDLMHLRDQIPLAVSDATLLRYSAVAAMEAATGAGRPMQVIRAGGDDPRFTLATDRFVAAALRQNASVSVINYPEAPHAFDVGLDTPQTRRIIGATLDFLTASMLRE
jgi:acetyl esterase/lipase